MHSLDDDDFEDKDAERPAASAHAAAEAGLQRIVYLGGLGDDGEDLSAHLRSRREVEELLGGGGVPVTVLRAGIVDRPRGHLLGDHPAAGRPPAGDGRARTGPTTRTQPIAIDDVVRYLVGVLEARGPRPGLRDRRAGACCPTSRCCRRSRRSRAAACRSCTVPVLTPRLSSRWLSLVTDVDVTTGRNLIDSMGVEVAGDGHSIRDLVPGEPLPYAESRCDGRSAERTRAPQG